jgi:DNA-directed RNA polymerase I subunit RPA49
MSEKKRKRREENGERPQKMVAVAPQGTVKVEMLDNKETLGPLLGMREASCDFAGKQELT